METPISGTVSTRLQRIADLAREAPGRAFLSLSHHIDLELLREAFRRTRKDGATGVDGRTGKEYEEDLEANLQSLLNRFKSGRYQAPPVRRTYVPKGDGSKTRPIGIPTFEDKVLQRAVAMVLEAVYEQDFVSCSHGYRPGRSAHGALRELREGLMSMGGGWVLEVDIKSFFDSLDHGQLRSILDQRVRDGVLRRTIDKWLSAGVLEGCRLSYPDAGTPQGGVVLTASGEHLPTRGRGQVVREGREAAALGSRFHGPFRGRSGHGLQQREGCAPGLGRAAKALWQVRPDSPPHQDPTASDPTRWVGQGAEGRHQETELRLSGVYPLLGTIPARALGGEAEDGERPLRACVAGGVGVAEGPSVRSGGLATPTAGAKATRA